MLFSFLLLMLNGLQGYLDFKIYNASHIQFAFISTIFYMFSESWIMFYFIGSGKTIKETILTYSLDKKIYGKVLESKKKLFPHITLNILIVGAVFVIGGGVHTKTISISMHGTLFIISMLHFLYLIKIQHENFKVTAEILTHLGTLIQKDK